MRDRSQRKLRLPHLVKSINNQRRLQKKGNHRGRFISRKLDKKFVSILNHIKQKLWTVVLLSQSKQKPKELKDSK